MEEKQNNVLYYISMRFTKSSTRHMKIFNTSRYFPSTTLHQTGGCHQCWSHMLPSLWLCCSWVLTTKVIKLLVTKTKIWRFKCVKVFLIKKFLVLLKFFACSAVLIVGGIRAHFCFKDAFCFHSFLSIKNKNYFHKRKSIIVSLSSFFHSLYNYLVLSNQQQGLKFWF